MTPNAYEMLPAVLDQLDEQAIGFMYRLTDHPDRADPAAVARAVETVETLRHALACTFTATFLEPLPEGACCPCPACGTPLVAGGDDRASLTQPGAYPGALASDSEV
jgi:hypothetical protein